MIIEQISVFIENKSGRLNEVMAILGDHDINVSALLKYEYPKYNAEKTTVIRRSTYRTLFIIFSPIQMLNMGWLA